MKLEIDLIPKSSFFKNVRSEVTSAEWDKIRKSVYAAANHRCEICNGKGRKWPVECHEIFSYNDESDPPIQKLERLIALCPSCHETIHIGLAQVRGRGEIAKKHYCKVNQCSGLEADQDIENAFRVWQERSKIEWVLDLTNLNNYK